MLALEYIKSNNQGDLYKCYKLENQEKKKVKYTLDNTSTLFGLENVYSKKYIKWIHLDPSIILAIKDIEKFLQEQFPEKQLKSCIIEKKNYPIMLNTKINISKNQSIIDNEKGEISSLAEYIQKKKNYSINILLENIFTNSQFIYYSLEIQKIKKVA